MHDTKTEDSLRFAKATYVFAFYLPNLPELLLVCPTNMHIAELGKCTLGVERLLRSISLTSKNGTGLAFCPT